MSITRALKCLQKGLDLPHFSIAYRYCALPLADDVEQIQEMIARVGARLVVVDSISADCAGDLNCAEVALRFFAAVRQ